MQVPASCASKRQASCTTTSLMNQLTPQTPRHSCQGNPLQQRTHTPAAMSEVSFNTYAALFCRAHHILWLCLLAEQPSLGTSPQGTMLPENDTACCPICAAF